MPKQMTSIRKILAQNLKEYRRRNGLTQEKLAEKAGISTNYLSMIEISRKFPTPEMMDRLAQALNIHTFQLFNPSATPDGALLHLEQVIITNLESIVEKIIKQDFFIELNQTITKIIKQELVKENRINKKK
ncbi:MAG: helix-turn-helix domain-containing protein [Treponema sp.]|nr:helix-turn-helix domain-containing protein [Treponema sp.]